MGEKELSIRERHSAVAVPQQCSLHPYNSKQMALCCRNFVFKCHVVHPVRSLAQASAANATSSIATRNMLAKHADCQIEVAAAKERQEIDVQGALDEQADLDSCQQKTLRHARHSQFKTSPLLSQPLRLRARKTWQNTGGSSQ